MAKRFHAAALVALLCLGGAAQGQIAPGDLFVADWSRGVFEIRAGGDFTSVVPFAFGLDGPDGLCVGPNGDFYVGEYLSGEVTVITGGGNFASATPFAEGLGNPTGLLCTSTQILVSDHGSGSVFDITAGGDFSMATPFATGLDGVGNLYRDSGGTVWAVSLSPGEVHDITAGGDFSALTPFVAAGNGLIDLAEFGGALLLSEFMTDSVLNATGGGSVAGLPLFATVPAARGLEHVPGLGFFGTSNQEVWEISAGGDFTAEPPFAFGFTTIDVGSMLYIEGCGDGIVQAGLGETCDDGNTANLDGCNSVCQLGFCAPAPVGACQATTEASLAITEKKAGKEKWKVSLKKYTSAVTPGDLGDPVAGGTAYHVCLYDETSALAAELGVDRAAALCGSKGKTCWKTKGSSGYAYKDPDASASGVKKIAARAGEANKGSVSVQAGNNAKKGQMDLPTGVTAALVGQAQATVQVVTSDAGCVQGVVSDIKQNHATQFKAKAP